jgi:hypothetical protein
VSYNRFFVVFGQIAEKFPRLMILGSGADGNLNHYCRRIASMAITAFSVAPAFRDVMLLILEINERRKACRSLQNDIAAFPAIAAVRSAARDVFLSSKTAHAISAIAGLYINLDLVNKQ